MPGSAPFRLNRSGMLLALISAAFAGEAAAAAGRVDFTTSGVTVSNRSGPARPLARGVELDTGDTVHTNAGRAQIRFTDGSYVSLQPNTDFAISDYKYDGKNDGSDRGFFGLIKGAMRTVTGAVGRVNRNAYRITTPTATVGIRGTGGVIQINPDGSTLVIGTSGIWSLTNPAGSIDVPAGVSGLAPSEPNTPPSETNTQPQTSTQPVQPEEQGYVEGNQVNPDGTAKILPAVLVSGSGFAAAITFAGGAAPGTPRIEGGDGATAVFNGAGQLTELTLNSETYKMQGSTLDFGTDGIVAWGRWVGTMTTTRSDCGGQQVSPCSATYSQTQGLHYVIGMPTPVMPTQGTGSYTLAGATTPTYADGSGLSTAKFSGSLSMDFGANRVSGQFNVNMQDGHTYAWGIAVNPTGALFQQGNQSVVHSGPGPAQCSSGCQASVQGFFAGASAERAGISYHIRDGNNIGKEVFGAAAFKK
jgi:hypothetical protein